MTVVSRILAGAVPVAPKGLVRPFAMRYIAGPGLEDAMATIRRLADTGRTATVDVLGEQLSGRDQIEALAEEYRRALDAFADAGLDATLSVKMTGLGLAVDESLCAANVRSLVAAAGERSLTIELDMEDSTTTTATIELYRSLRAEGLDNVVIALQAYLRRSLDDLRSLLGLEPRVRLVKGIWIERPELVYGDYDVVRGNYLRLLEELLAAGGFAAIASHDEWIHWRALELIDRLGVASDRYEFQMLLGVREPLGDALVEGGHRLRVYVPYGSHWHEYSVRRFKENPQLAQHVAADVVDRARRRVGL
jgi:proline dehydrogenase